MRNIVFSFSLVLCSTLCSAAQDVAGMSIEYGPIFQAKVEKAETWRAKMPENLKTVVLSFEVFEAPSIDGLGEARVIKTRFSPKAFGNLDAAASESIQNIVRLPGIKNPTKTITKVTVSGFQARRISFESERYDGKLGAEFLIVYNERTSTAYHLQLIFSKKPTLNPFGTLSLADEHTRASNIVDTVRITSP